MIVFSFQLSVGNRSSLLQKRRGNLAIGENKKVRLETAPTGLGVSFVTEVQRLYRVLSDRHESCRASDL